MTEDQADRLGRIVDSLDSGLYALKLPVPASIHIEGMSGIMRNARDEIAALVIEITGENPWSTNPLEG